MTKKIFAIIVLITFSGCKSKIEQAIDLSHEGKYKEAYELLDKIPSNDPQTREALAWRQLFIFRGSPGNASVQSYIDCIVAINGVQPIEESSKHYKILRRELLRKLNDKSCKNDDFLLVINNAQLIGYPENVIAAIKKKLEENISTYVKQITYKEGYKEAFPLLEELLKSYLPEIGPIESIRGILDTMLITWGTGIWFRRENGAIASDPDALNILIIRKDHIFKIQNRGWVLRELVWQDITGLWEIDYKNDGLPYFKAYPPFFVSGTSNLVPDIYKFYKDLNNLLLKGEWSEKYKSDSLEFVRIIGDQDWFNEQLRLYGISVK
jgi:tetratricopeptide (TPR) repeat protein